MDTVWRMRHSREVTYDAGLTYLRLMPTGQYEMKQTSDEVRCVPNDGEWMLAQTGELIRRVNRLKVKVSMRPVDQAGV